MRYSGTIEGFYGQPWSDSQRLALFSWMKQWGMNSYLYAPKDDLKHRKLWRELYNEKELVDLQLLIKNASDSDVDFIYAISPGLDINYETEANLLLNKIDQVIALGCKKFAILFDDIPGKPNADDQAKITNQVLSHIPDNRLLFCPTVYCDMMAEYKVEGNEYLIELGDTLDKGIDIMWTGPEVVSLEIPVESIVNLQKVIKRKPVIWDNIHANDYDLHRVFVGPYSGRPMELKDEVEGIMSNPNCQFWVNYIPLKTLAVYCKMDSYNPRDEYLKMIPEWLTCFNEHELTEQEMTLFGDCFYLPGESGELAKTALDDKTSFSKIVHAMYEKISEISNREMFYDLHKYFWELRKVACAIDGRPITHKQSDVVVDLLKRLK
jgi:protein O-GlcNAcase / histone acetyltransferase